MGLKASATGLGSDRDNDRRCERHVREVGVRRRRGNIVEGAPGLVDAGDIMDEEEDACDAPVVEEGGYNVDQAGEELELSSAMAWMTAVVDWA